MSFTIVEQTAPRANRSELAVPANNPALFEKAARSAADVVFLDLEDSVAPRDKPQARKNVITGLREIDWGARTVSVRINGLDTPYMYRDVIEVIEQGGERLDLIMIPKVGTAADVYAVDLLVSQVETAVGKKKRVGFELLIETALGMANVREIASASKRNESLHFGVADYAASIRARTTQIGGVNPDYVVLADADPSGHRPTFWLDPWQVPLSQLIVAARAAGLRPIDGPFGDFRDAEGYKAAARRIAALGAEGKWAIHPSQIDLANAIFAPSASEIERARRILAALEEAAKEGRGAVTLDGRMIDIASIRQAENLIAKARQFGMG